MCNECVTEVTTKKEQEMNKEFHEMVKEPTGTRMLSKKQKPTTHICSFELMQMEMRIKIKFQMRKFLQRSLIFKMSFGL